MSRARVWVTGLGLVTPLGVGVEETWARLVRGERGIVPLSLFDATGQRAAMAGEVDEASVFAGATSASWSRTSAMAAVAAAEAMRAASVDVRQTRVGLVVGGTTGGMFENERVLARLHAEPDCREMLVQMLSHPLTATGDCLDQRLGPFARVRTLSSACSSGANALVVAAAWLLEGEIDVVVAGGSDGLCRLTLSGFNALGALDPQPCRPFDRRRRGTNLGEGAGFLVLERAERARDRRAVPVAELAGWAVGAEAHHITNPAPDGALVASLIEQALGRAGLTARDVDYVNAHGTGTPHNDAMEAAALARALGLEVGRVPVSSSKGQIGHTLAGAGAIEAAITALVVSRRVLVPTGGLEEPDPALGLVHVPGVGREVPRVRAALSNAFGFGGMDTVLVFADPRLGAVEGRFPASAPPRVSRSCRRPVITGAAVFGACGLLSSEQAARVPEGAFQGSPVDLDGDLDPVRGRRLDRAARLAVVAVERALAEAGGDRRATGVLLGSAYGNVDGSAAFVHRLFDRGPRAASPAEFPNLVPSSPVGHLSIYLGLQGPTFALADLATSGEAAFVQAVQLVDGGQASRLVAGAVEPRSDIVERVLSALFAHAASQVHARRCDLAAALVIEPARAGEGRGVLASVAHVREWRGDAPDFGGLPPPRSAHAEVVLAREEPVAARILARSDWGNRARRLCSPPLGESDALGAVALAVAAGRVAHGLVDEVLVVGLAKGRGYAIILER